VVKTFFIGGNRAKKWAQSRHIFLERVIPNNFYAVNKMSFWIKGIKICEIGDFIQRGCEYQNVPIWIHFDVMKRGLVIWEIGVFFHIFLCALKNLSPSGIRHSCKPFVFNGGPGSASVWVHMGAFWPPKKWL